MTIDVVYLELKKNGEPAIIIVGDNVNTKDIKLGCLFETGELMVEIEGDVYVWSIDKDIVIFIEEAIVRGYIRLFIRIIKGCYVTDNDDIVVASETVDGRIILTDEGINRLKKLVSKVYNKL